MNKIYLSVIGLILAVLTGLGIYSYFKISNQNREIDNLNIMLTTKNMQISSLETRLKIDAETNDLGLRLTSSVHVELAKISDKYNTIEKNMTKNVNNADKDDPNAVSEIVINTIWDGYRSINE